MKKIRKTIACLITSLTMILCFSGCEMQFVTATVMSVEKTSTDGLVDTYTITYSDGTQSTFEVTNGQDGKDGENGKDGKDGTDGQDGENAPITVQDLYNEYVARYGENITYAEFLDIYLAVGESEYTAVHKTLLSTAKVYTQFTETQENEAKTVGYTGAAVVYKMDSEYTYFLTNYHVVYDNKAVGDKICQTPYCYLYGSEDRPSKQSDGTVDYGDYAIQTTYVGGSASYDLALLRASTARVKEINENVSAVTFASDYKVGETAIAIGNPAGYGISVTKGIVSVDSENISLSVDGTERTYRSVRMDTSIYGGNSGGGLFNAQGQLIGLVNAKSTKNDNMCYAIPLSRVKAAADNLYRNVAKKGVYALTFGITTAAQNSKYTYDPQSGYGRVTEETLILEVEENSIAQSMGLQVGDILKKLTVNEQEYTLTRYFELSEYRLYIKDGDSVTLTYERGGAEYTTAPRDIRPIDLNNIA